MDSGNDMDINKKYKIKLSNKIDPILIYKIFILLSEMKFVLISKNSVFCNFSLVLQNFVEIHKLYKFKNFFADTQFLRSNLPSELFMFKNSHLSTHVTQKLSKSNLRYIIKARVNAI